MPIHIPMDTQNIQMINKCITHHTSAERGENKPWQNYKHFIPTLNARLQLILATSLKITLLIPYSTAERSVIDTSMGRFAPIRPHQQPAVRGESDK